MNAKELKLNQIFQSTTGAFQVIVLSKIHEYLVYQNVFVLFTSSFKFDALNRCYCK